MKKLTAYRVECEFSKLNDSDAHQFCFTHITAEPIESHYSYLINIICGNTLLTIKDIERGCYFDMQIFRVGSIKM